MEVNKPSPFTLSPIDLIIAVHIDAEAVLDYLTSLEVENRRLKLTENGAFRPHMQSITHDAFNRMIIAIDEVIKTTNSTFGTMQEQIQKLLRDRSQIAASVPVYARPTALRHYPEPKSVVDNIDPLTTRRGKGPLSISDLQQAFLKYDPLARDSKVVQSSDTVLQSFLDSARSVGIKCQPPAVIYNPSGVENTPPITNVASGRTAEGILNGKNTKPAPKTNIAGPSFHNGPDLKARRGQKADDLMVPKFSEFFKVTRDENDNNSLVKETGGGIDGSHVTMNPQSLTYSTTELLNLSNTKQRNPFEQNRNDELRTILKLGGEKQTTLQLNAHRIRINSKPEHDTSSSLGHFIDPLNSEIRKAAGDVIHNTPDPKTLQPRIALPVDWINARKNIVKTEHGKGSSQNILISSSGRQLLSDPAAYPKLGAQKAADAVLDIQDPATLAVADAQRVIDKSKVLPVKDTDTIAVDPASRASQPLLPAAKNTEKNPIIARNDDAASFLAWLERRSPASFRQD